MCTSKTPTANVQQTGRNTPPCWLNLLITFQCTVMSYHTKYSRGGTTFCVETGQPHIYEWYQMYCKGRTPTLHLFSHNSTMLSNDTHSSSVAEVHGQSTRTNWLRGWCVADSLGCDNAMFLHMIAQIKKLQNGQSWNLSCKYYTLV